MALNQLFDDFARVASGAASAFGGLREEAEIRVREQVERMLARLDLVTRAEFDAVKEVAVLARTAQEDLEARVAALEAALARREPAPAAPRASRRKPVTDAAAEASAEIGGESPGPGTDVDP